MSETSDLPSEKLAPPRTTAAPAEAPTFLVPLPLALVSSGVLAAVAAQLFVTADDFLRLYERPGVALPWITQHVLESPHGVPAALLGLAILTLVGGRLPRPAGETAGRLARDLSVLFVVSAVLYACLLAFGMPIALEEMQKAVQQ